MPLGVLSILGLGAIGAAGLAALSARRRQLDWLALCKSMDLTPKRATLGWSYEAKGVYKGTEIRITRFENEARTVVLVDGLTPNLRLDCQGTLAFGEDLAIGDPIFDAHVKVQSDIGLWALGFLDDKTRTSVFGKLRREQFKLAQGQAKVSVDRHPVTRQEMRDLLNDAMEMTLSFRADPNSKTFLGRVERIATKDPQPDVRVNALRALYLSRHGCSTKVLARAARDSDPKVRMAALILSRDAKALADIRADSSVWPQIADAPFALQISVIAELENSPNGEPGLIYFLLQPDPDLAAHAVKALANGGSEHALDALDRVGKAFGKERELKLAASEAATQIRARLTSAGGQLSIVETPHGELSLAESKGELSLSDEKVLLSTSKGADTRDV